MARIDQALDRLEEHPGRAWCRRRRFRNIGVRGIAVVSDGTEWLILWSPGSGGTTEDDAVIVEAIVPARPGTWRKTPWSARVPGDMGSLIKKRRKRMRKKKHKKMLKATRWQRRAAGK